MFLCHFKGLFEVSELDHNFDGFLVLSILEEELNTGLEGLLIVWVISRDLLGWKVVNRDVVAHSQIHGLLLVATPHVERDSLVELALPLEVLPTLHHILLARYQTHGHDLLIIPALLCKADSMMQSL